MSESNQGRGREQEPLVPVFGDVIIAKDFNYERPSIVVETVGNRMLQAIGIIDDEKNRYGWPGTLAIEDVISIIGRMSFEEVVDAYSSAFGETGLSTAVLRARLTAQASTFPKSD